MKKKSSYWQIVRGICILAVVMIHCPSGKSYDVGSIEFNSWVLLRQFIDFPVAVFFFMSGYFVNPERVEEDARKYILTRGGYLLIPYLLWSLFYSGVSIARCVVSSDPIKPTSYIFKFLTGSAATPLYYIVCLLQFTVLTPWLIHVIKQNGRMSKLLWWVTPLYAILLYFAHVVAPDSRWMAGTLNGVIFPAWLLFYYLGLRIRVNGGIQSKSLKAIGQFKMVAFALLLECVEAAMIVKMGLGFQASQLKITSYFYSMVICLWLYNNSPGFHDGENMVRGLSRHIGDRAYGIFYVHCFILMFTYKICSIIGIEDFWFVYFIFSFIFTAAISLLVVDAVNVLARMVKREKVLKWIGF